MSSKEAKKLDSVAIIPAGKKEKKKIVMIAENDILSI